MAQKGVIAVCLAVTLSIACGHQSANQPPAPTPASGPAAAVQPHSYQGVGVVKALNPKAPAIEIDHEEIVGLMPAMQMEFPVTKASLLEGLAVNDRIDFTVVDDTGQMTVTAIKKK
jgi:Cu/Ag efflux protein CusF